MNTEIIKVKNGRIKIDKSTIINFDTDYVHAPDTSLFIGFDFGKIKKENAEQSYNKAGFKFYKIIEADKNLNLPLPELSE